MKNVICLLIIYFPTQSFSRFYTESEISDLCLKGNADSNPPSLSPGNDTIDFIKNLKNKNFLKEYYNNDDVIFTNSEQLKYSLKIAPWCVFLYFFFLGIVLWVMFNFCIFCKCCFCLGGPATQVQTRKRKMLPLAFLVIFGLFSLVISPYSIYYSNNLEANFKYQLCTTARWSGGYYYGHDN